MQVVGCSQGEVGEDFEVADAVGAELEVAGGDVVGGLAFQGGEVGCLNGSRKAQRCDLILDIWRKWLDSDMSEGSLVLRWWVRWRRDLVAAVVSLCGGRWREFVSVRHTLSRFVAHMSDLE